MSGMYLRKRVPDAPQDPTMTHVDDPQSFHVGEYIRKYSGVYRIVEIDNNWFDDPDIRFAHVDKVWSAPNECIVHDVREWQIETFVWGAMTSDGQPITKEQARAALSEMYPDA